MEEKLVTPPIRTAILEDKTPARDWWLHWNALTLRANQSAAEIDQVETNVAELVANVDSLDQDIDRMLRAGTHATRIAMPAGPIGALWAETDRSNVLYQAQTVAGAMVWRYAAGVMYGTLAPDQRPADLGANDGGFEFRATDTDPANTGREWIWSGTAWVETSQVMYGTHASRPTPAAAPARCIYVEMDRGPMYQNQLGHWIYLAGIMWGTLAPDQRPTDLTSFDTGFTFRTNVPPAREFMWSGVGWVEITPPDVSGLTHPNVVTKVGATAGTLAEGGITDESSANSDRLHITAGGNVGIGTASAGTKFEVVGRITASGASEPYGLGLRFNPASPLIYIGANGAGGFSISSAAGTVLVTIDQTGRITLPLPGSSPGVGTKMLWYDPADGNRVKFSA